MGLEGTIKFQDLVLGLLLGLYIIYAIQLARTFLGVWCRMTSVDKTGFNLLAMGLVTAFWPCLICPCYMELLASTKFSKADTKEIKYLILSD